MSVKQSEGISRRNGSDDMRDEEEMCDEDRDKDNLGEEQSSYRVDLIDEGDRFKSDQVDNDRWGEQSHDQLNEIGVKNDVEFERYEPYQDYEWKYDSGFQQVAYRGGSPTLQSSRKDIGRDNSDEVNLKRPHNANFQVTCYRCGSSGHMMRNCTQEISSLRKSTRFDPRHEDDINRRGRASELGRFGSRSWERSSKDSIPKRILKNDKQSFALGKHKKPISNVSSPVGNETDKSSKKHDRGNKRSNKEIGSPKRHCTKKSRRSFSSSLHSKSRSSSQSLKHMKRSRSHSRSGSISSRARSLSSKSRSTSTSHYSRSKSSKFMARTTSRTSLSASHGRPLLSSSNKGSDNITTPDSKEILIEQGQPVEADNGLEDIKLESRRVAVNDENGATPSKADIEMEKGQPPDKDTEGHQMESWSFCEVTNPSTLAVEKGIVDNRSFSPKSLDYERFSSKSLVEMNYQNSDKLMTENMPVQMRNPDSNPPVISGSSHSLSISSEELRLVMKHYYGHDFQHEKERDLPAEEYFGSARLWPWDIIYYRRSKKGPISVENYARRLDQNREFGIVDKYIRSSSGWA